MNFAIPTRTSQADIEEIFGVSYHPFTIVHGSENMIVGALTDLLEFTLCGVLAPRLVSLRMVGPYCNSRIEAKLGRLRLPETERVPK